jgi:hypothetical protein
MDFDHTPIIVIIFTITVITTSSICIDGLNVVSVRLYKDISVNPIEISTLNFNSTLRQKYLTSAALKCLKNSRTNIKTLN